MKNCNKCSVEKSDDEFYKHAKNKGGLSHWCKECSKAHSRYCYKEDVGAARTKAKLWKQANPQREKDIKLRRDYGITLQQYDDMRDAQDGCCAICKKHENALPKVLYVDHDHTTGDVRGLLCNKCNSVLGMAEDDIDILSEAIGYLKKSKKLM